MDMKANQEEPQPRPLRKTPVTEEAQPEEVEEENPESPPHSPDARPLPRRSGRIRQPPARFQSGDFITNFSAQTQQDQKILLLTKLIDLLQ